MRVQRNRTVFLFLVLCCLLLTRIGHALGDVWLSSNTSTADSTSTLCGQFSVVNGTNTLIVPAQGVIHGVNISSGVALTTLQLYDSSWTIVSATSSLTIGPIMTTAMTPTVFYDTVFRHGLSYVKTGTATVQILYACY